MRGSILLLLFGWGGGVDGLVGGFEPGQGCGKGDEDHQPKPHDYDEPAPERWWVTLSHPSEPGEHTSVLECEPNRKAKGEKAYEKLQEINQGNL